MTNKNGRINRSLKSFSQFSVYEKAEVIKWLKS